MKFTLADCIAMNVRSFPDRPAIEVLGSVPESYTFREAWLRVSALADALRGVPAGPHGPAEPEIAHVVNDPGAALICSAATCCLRRGR